MDSSCLLSVATFLYGSAALLYVVSAIMNKIKIAIYGRYFAYFGIFVITSGILLRWIESYRMGIGHVPLSNLYESLVFFAWAIVAFYLYVEKKYDSVFVGAFVVPIGFFSIAYASLSPDINNTIRPLVPALQSNWLIAHVVTCFLGYAAFTISFALSIIYILIIKRIVSFSFASIVFPNIDLIEELNYKMNTLGFLFLSIGIITGSVWANVAWGSYWSWDPKETWSLITWLIYATLLHMSLIKNWGGEKIAYVCIIGFASVLFTYFGVNYLHGLHSYSKS